MKNNLLYFLLILVLFSSCSKKTYTSLYDKNVKFIDNKSKYCLSKNLLKLEIIYTVNEPRVQKNGIDEALTARKTIVTIEDPIQLTTLLVADTSQTFFTTGKKLPEDSYVNSGTNAKNFLIGETQSIFSVKEATSKTLSTGILTDSNIQADAYRSVLEIKNNITKIKTADQANFTLSLVYAYKNQSTIVNEAYKPYVKKSKVKYTIVIDPTKVYTDIGKWSNSKNENIIHTIYPHHLFKKNSDLLDTITLITPHIKAAKLTNSSYKNPTEGIIYRNSTPIHLEAKINNTSLKSQKLTLIQYDSLKTISTETLKNNPELAITLFRSEDLENKMSFEEKIETLDDAPTQTIEESQIRIRKEYETKLANINLLIKRLQERKAEL